MYYTETNTYLHWYYTYCKHYGIPQCTSNYIVLGRFIGGPDDDLKELKHVALE
jgi:hypothetical protein